MLRGDPADDADAVDSLEPLRFGQRGELRAEDRLPGMLSCLAIAAPVTTSSPVTIRTRMCAACASLTAAFDSSRGGSTMPTRLVISRSLDQG